MLNRGASMGDDQWMSRSIEIKKKQAEEVEYLGGTLNYGPRF